MSFYDQGEDYIDSFLPFVLGAIKDSADIKGIQSNLKAELRYRDALSRSY